TMAQRTEAVGQTPKKGAVPRDEGLIGGAETGEEPRELRKRGGERGEGDHGEGGVTGIHVGAGEGAGLPLRYPSPARLEGRAARLPEPRPAGRRRGAPHRRSRRAPRAREPPTP